MSKFSTQDYNFVAKRIREVYPADVFQDMKYKINSQRGILEDLALNMAKKYAEDNDYFDPIKFLDACSPDTDRFPLSELWEQEEEK